VALVTTNFDTLFERALEVCEGARRARPQSLSGQALPPPGSQDFAGVIHLHGRLGDEKLGLERTAVVLTSAQYGDAYMRSGWAARFLFDLARCRTLVLVGYRARDAPVRYFLNVLEADRGRFRDLRAVYALDAVGDNAADAEDAWTALAVHPVTYRRAPPTAEFGKHGALWRDLERLAELVERPNVRRRQRLAAILGRPLAAASTSDLAFVDWLLRRRGDLWRGRMSPSHTVKSHAY
jgi:hypothetical protein